MDDVTFVYTFNADLKKGNDISNTNIVLFKNFDEKKNICNCEIKDENIKNFLNNNRFKTFAEFDDDSIKRIF